jgi:hypothetical protein
MEELIPIVLFLSIAAVMILRPLTTRLGKLIEQMALQRAQYTASGGAELAEMRVALDHLGKRLDLLDERQDFTERLVAERRVRAPTRPALSAQ